MLVLIHLIGHTFTTLLMLGTITNMKRVISGVKGFTLIELIVVIAVIGILATITVIGFNRYQADTRDARRVSSVTTISEALEKYYDANGEYPGCSQVTADATAVTNATLKGLDTTTLIAPQASSGTTNSLACETLTIAGNDFFEYVGDGSPACQTNGACLEYKIKYKSESSGSGGEIKELSSRRSTSVATSGTPVLTLTDTDFDHVSLSWTTVAGASSYLVQRSAAADTNFNNPIEYQTPTSAGTFDPNGLATATTYNFRVRPNATSSVGNFSNTIQATTQSLSTPVITAAPNSATAISVTWPAVSGADSYTLRYSTSPTLASGVTNVPNITGTSRTITGLTTGTTYYFQLQAVSGSFTSSWSAIKNAVPIGQAVITSTTASACGAITVNWDALNGATTYTARWSANSNMSGATAVIGLTGTSTVLNGVPQGTTVYVTMSGVTSGGYSGQASTTASQMTTACAPAAYTISAYDNGGAWTATANATCASGTTAYYQWYANGGGWVAGDQYRTVGYSLGYGQGITLTVTTRCYNANGTSGWTNANNSAGYTRPVPAPNLNALSVGSNRRVNASWSAVCGGLNELLLRQGSYQDTSSARFAQPNNYANTDSRTWYSSGTVRYNVRTNCNGVWSGWSNERTASV